MTPHPAITCLLMGGWTAPSQVLRSEPKSNDNTPIALFPHPVFIRRGSGRRSSQTRCPPTLIANSGYAQANAKLGRSDGPARTWRALLYRSYAWFKLDHYSEGPSLTWLRFDLRRSPGQPRGIAFPDDGLTQDWDRRSRVLDVACILTVFGEYYAAV